QESDKAGLTLKPVAEALSEKLGQEVIFVPETRGEKLESAIKNLKEGDVLLVENTRFEDLDGKKESKNDPELGKYWASLGDVFVNDAFGTAHREHASNVGISTHLETAAGYLMEKEIKFIGGVVNDPHKPVVAILGGAKVSDKIGVIKNLVNITDKILIGGGMAYTFIKAQGHEIGKSLLEEDKIDFAKELLASNGDQIILPVDAKVAAEFSNDAAITEVAIDQIPADQEALDVGPKTVELFNKELQGAHTVVWNGPMGVFEFSNFAQGTIGVCKSIAALDDAITIIGGGDSAAAAISLGFADDFTHISTGGGASLEYLEGKELPGIKAINNK
ncbi:MAG: phosphoglycerate kinase, partial [Staphylococcus lugdunensis]|nr:phosphoglycerate kinase [Staphylococcus lugdunensis]